MYISSINAIEVLDSRGNPTIKTFVELSDGSIGWSIVPSGASTGTHEAVELRDNDNDRYMGKGVLKAIENIHNLILPSLKGLSFETIREIDTRMVKVDGTENKSHIGANSILSVSMSLARAIAKSQKKQLWEILAIEFFSDSNQKLPRIMVNMINGGAHAEWNFDIQEFLIIPKSYSPSESVEQASELFHNLSYILEQKGLSTLKGDEGGFSPHINSNEEVFDLLRDLLVQYPEYAIDLGIDSAASEWFDNDTYIFKSQKKQGHTITFTREDLIDWYIELKNKYNLYSFEDVFHEDDWEGFSKLLEKIGNNSLIIGDDLFTTNTERIKKGIENKSANAIIIKPNQIGTLTETAEAIKLAKNQNWKIIISHRSGDTEDPFIADLSYSCGADFLKSGSMSRSERLCKYNRLIEIEKSISV